MSLPAPITNAITGNVYNWRWWSPVQTTNIPVGGDVQLNVQFTAAPVNDDFENARKLSDARLRSHASNLGATSEIDEPGHLGNPGGSSVWFSWTAPASGLVTLSTNEISPYAPPGWQTYGYSWITMVIFPTCGVEVDKDPPAPFFPIFAAYTGDAVGSLTAADNLPLLLDAVPHAVSFDVVEGENYHIAFDGNKVTTGDIPMFLALTRPASNDAFERKIRLRGVSIAATANRALLQYATVPGQRIVLLSSNNGTGWHQIATARVRGNSGLFGVRKAPADSGPFYRAVIVDRY